MKLLKQIKSNLKEQKKLKEYDRVFKHKQMKFLVTKIALVFSDDINIDKFTKLEIKLSESKKGPDMFSESIKTLEEETKYKADWKSFANFLWFIYQTSTYYRDLKKGMENVYVDNIIKINEKRRNIYNTWMESLAKDDSQFNHKITQVSKLVF